MASARIPQSVAALLLGACAVAAQNTDVPNNLVAVGQNAVPQQLFPGDYEQIYEINSSGSAKYHSSNSTRPLALTNYGVWGQDEGPSVQLPGVDGRVIWYWGDTVTAYQISFLGTHCAVGAAPPGWCAYQNSTNCNGTAGGCLGVDTVSFISQADAANVPKCTHLLGWDNSLISGGTPVSGTCPTMEYIVDTVHHGAGSGIPTAGFTYEQIPAKGTTGGLVSGEDMLAGHTATGVFTLTDTLGVNRLYTVYTVSSLTSSGGNNGYAFRTESVLLRTPASTTAINSTAMPYLNRIAPFSQAPTSIPAGTATAVDNGGTPPTSTLTACSGTTFDPNWAHQSSWQGILIAGKLYPGTAPASTTTLTLQGDVAISSCAGFNAVPNPDTSTGKFMFASPQLVTQTMISNLGVGSLLPSALQSTNLICFWGSGFYYRNTNVYFGCMAADDATASTAAYTAGSGLNVMWYVTGLDPHTGAPTWTSGTVAGAEAAAVPLLSSWGSINTFTGANSPCVGEQSVRWIGALNRFVMAYGNENCGGLWYRTASVPWGPWSAATLFFSNSTAVNPWEERLIGVSGSGPRNFNAQTNVLMKDGNSATTINTESLEPYKSSGNPYGPYLLPDLSNGDNGDGTVTVFMNVSGFNFYGAWQLGLRLYKAPAVGVSPGVKIAPGVLISHL